MTENQKSKVSLNCAHCGAFAQHTWYLIFAKSAGEGNFPEIRNKCELSGEHPFKIITEPTRSFAQLKKRLEGFEPIGFELNLIETPVECDIETGNFRLSNCHACKNNSLWIGNSIVYPHKNFEGPIPNEDLPEEIKRDFNEARSILNQSPRGATALLRLCLQKLCIHFKLPGEHLASDIEKLVLKGVSRSLVEAMHVLRVIGNAAVHPGKIPEVEERETAIALCHLLNLIATRLLSEKRLVAQINNLLPEDKRRSISELDSLPWEY